MKSATFPRIVANGKWYRIEIGHAIYDRYIPLGTFCFGLPIWETRFLGRAIARLTKMRAEDAHQDPDNWKPVL